MAQINERLWRVGPGWEKILMDLHAKLILVYPDYSVSQVKEKFGELRVYLGSYPNHEVLEACHTLLSDACVESLKTCEDCGQSGELGGRSWLKTACEDCRRGPASLRSS